MLHLQAAESLLKRIRGLVQDTFVCQGANAFENIHCGIESLRAYVAFVPVIQARQADPVILVFATKHGFASGKRYICGLEAPARLV